MKKSLTPLAVLALLSFAPAGAAAAPAHSPEQPALLAALYPIPPATPATPAAAAHVSASDVTNQLSGMTPAALGKGVVELHAAASGPGTISIVLSARIHGKTVVIGSGHKTAGAAGTLEVAFKLTAAGKSALAGHKNLKLTVAVVFHPQHGAKKTASAKVALK
jgi:hypothetical protein